jgi:hypothetical protein
MEWIQISCWFCCAFWRMNQLVPFRITVGLSWDIEGIQTVDFWIWIVWQSVETVYKHGVKRRAFCIMTVPALISRTGQVIVPFNYASCESKGARPPSKSRNAQDARTVCMLSWLRYGRSKICVVTHVLLLGPLDWLGIRNRLGGECRRQQCRAVHASTSDWYRIDRWCLDMTKCTSKHLRAALAATFALCTNDLV